MPASRSSKKPVSPDRSRGSALPCRDRHGGARRGAARRPEWRASSWTARGSSPLRYRSRRGLLRAATPRRLPADRVHEHGLISLAHAGVGAGAPWLGAETPSHLARAGRQGCEAAGVLEEAP